MNLKKLELSIVKKLRTQTLLPVLPVGRSYEVVVVMGQAAEIAY